MTEIQQHLLEILQFFNQICEEYNIPYYAVGGTLLGAVRHGGFIPWDDDLDVGVPRKDYQRLISILSGRKGRFILESPYACLDDYQYAYAKLYDSMTTVIEDSAHPCTRGIFLDIFPLDGIGNTAKEVRRNLRSVTIKNRLIAAYNMKKRQGRTRWKSILLGLLKAIPERVFNIRKRVIKLNELCSRIDFDKTAFGGILLGSYGMKDIMPRELFNDIEQYKFETSYVKGVKNYDAFLTHVYGDWRQLPPENKRKSGHDLTYVNLHQSYLTGANSDK